MCCFPVQTKLPSLPRPQPTNSMHIQTRPPFPLNMHTQTKADIAASFQQVAVQHLTQRVARGIAWARELVPGLSHLVVAGGVASNQHIRCVKPAHME